MPTITTADIALLASARMTDLADGGGAMSGTALQDGTENNVFPDISGTDRAFGRLALRKVWPAVLNNGTDTLLGAHAILDDAPDDANVGAWAMLGTSTTEDRAGALARLEQSHWEALGPTGLTWAAAPYAFTRIKSVAGTVPVTIGTVLFSLYASGSYANPVIVTGVTEIGSGDGTYSTGFAAMAGGDRVFAITYDGVVDPTGIGAALGVRLGVPSTVSPRLASVQAISGALSIGDTFCDVASVLAPVIPKHLGSAAGSVAQIGINAAAVIPGGVAAAFRAGDGLVIHHTAVVAAATYANTNTVNCGRTNLAGVRVIGLDGRAILTGWTANLATGIVTINDISGWAQPVTVRHTIEEVLGCSRTGYPEVPGGATGGGVSLASTPFVLSDGLTMYCGRPNVGRLRVLSKTGQDITDLTVFLGGVSGVRVFSVSLAAGAVDFSAGSMASSIITSHSPVTLVSSGSFAAAGVTSAAQSTLNRLTFNRPLTKAFPAGSMVSSMLLLGDLQAQAGQSFAQESWTQVWADARIGSAIIPQYQQVANPIVVSNAGAISERWAIIFLTSTTFRVVGETTGQITTGDTASPLTPINPATGQPYFSIAAVGWGAGWASGNVLRFNTQGANAPVWVARAVLPSAPSATPDSLTIAVRGDIDA